MLQQASMGCILTRVDPVGDRPPKTYESNFIHHDFHNSENSIREK